VARRLPAARFILFGGGELQDEMERLAERSGLRGRLIFAGIATEILDMIGMMDVLLLTSAFEGIPNVVLEAQWAGTPVVATRAGGTPEAVEEGLTGWIVDKPSAAALAERLIWLHRNSAVAQGARLRGPTFVRKKFGVRRMVDETVALYGLRHMRGIEAADPE
jgi:glycosyltransferase involved in cell wall biosynthesis